MTLSGRCWRHWVYSFTPTVRWLCRATYNERYLAPCLTRAASILPHGWLIPGLNFADEAKASAIAELDLEWMCREAEWLKRQLHPSPERNGGEAPTKTTSAEEGLPARCIRLIHASRLVVLRVALTVHFEKFMPWYPRVKRAAGLRGTLFFLCVRKGGQCCWCLPSRLCGLQQ